MEVLIGLGIFSSLAFCRRVSDMVIELFAKYSLKLFLCPSRLRDLL
jgi:hypothetical protein